MDRFNEIMDVVLRWEGGFVNNPYDNGGPTNFGITHEVLAAWRGLAGVSPQDVKNMGRQEAISIFKDRYWEKIQGDALPVPIDLIVMDGAVNHGIRQMSRMLQEALGVSPDGSIGSTTIAAVTEQTSSQSTLLALAVKLADARKFRYQNHEDAVHFLNGWRNRLSDVMSNALRSYPVSWSFKDGAKNGPGEPLMESEPVSSILANAITDADLQNALTAMGHYRGDIDGMFGPKSVAALEVALAQSTPIISGNWQAWPLPRRKIALGQLICQSMEIDVGRVDGLFGPQTSHAFEVFNRKKIGVTDGSWRDEIEAGPVLVESPVERWPREGDVLSTFGTLGNKCALVPLKRLSLPYPMKLAWDLGTEITGFRIHERVYDSAARVLDQVHAYYREDGVEELGINLFGGCHSCRKKRGGSSWSMHSWAIAIDFDPGRNQLSWNHTRARLAKPDASKFWELWEAEGWVSLGRAKDFDWMHVQAARL